MSKLFKKAAIFTDLHLGSKSNSSVHNEDCLGFVRWFIDQAHQENCDICLFLGDFHNNRNSLNVLTMNYSLQCLDLLSNAFDRTIMIPGNHDCFYKDNRSVHSIAFAEHVPKIEVINKWHKEGDVIFVPWLVGDEHRKIVNAKAKYMFGHFELPNFIMNAAVRMPDVGEVKIDEFSKVDEVYSGHFHIRQVNKNVTYIGNAFPHNYNDAWDDNRGMMILEWGKGPDYRAWPDAPKYRTYKLSDFVKKVETLKPNTYARVSIDIDISYEEANYLKETIVDEYKLRELSLVPYKSEMDETNVEQEDLSVQSVDSIVTSQIANIESEFYKTDLLLKIYKEL